MPEKKIHRDIQFHARPQEGEGGYMTEVQIIRRVTEYPVSAANAVQWKQGTTTESEFTVKVGEIGALVSELTGILVYYASGEAEKDRQMS